MKAALVLRRAAIIAAIVAVFFLFLAQFIYALAAIGTLYGPWAVIAILAVQAYGYFFAQSHLDWLRQSWDPAEHDACGKAGQDEEPVHFHSWADIKADNARERPWPPEVGTIVYVKGQPEPLTVIEVPHADDKYVGGQVRVWGCPGGSPLRYSHWLPLAALEYGE